MKQIILIFFVFYINLYSQPRLTMPKSKDLGIIPVGTVKYDYFEIINESQDTFFIENVYKYDTNPYIIAYKGNYIWSYDVWSSSEVAPKIIFPGEKRAFTYECNSKYEDSISINGGKLKTKFEIQYVKYGTDNILKDTFSIYNTCKTIKDSIFISSSGYFAKTIACPNVNNNYIYQNYLLLYNKFEDFAILDSIEVSSIDSNLNFYGLINNDSNANYPKVKPDSFPFKFTNKRPALIGWYSSQYIKNNQKSFIKLFVSTNNNKQFTIIDSIILKINKSNEGIIQNNNYYINSKLGITNQFQNKLSVSGCSFKNIILDSLSFTDWEKDELEIYNDLGLPLTLENGFYYNLSFNYTPKKTGKTRGKIKAHFRDETGNTFYRYCYLYTEVDDVNDVELSKENPLAFYPNPVNSLATLLLDEEPSVGEQVGIYNSLGTIVKTFEVSGKFTQVNTEGFAEGVYIARLLWSGKSVKFCVVR
ncbi:MAG: hypothetical protein NTW25_08570 [Candidatus Kapabacteria bacterium]|nr:hypothetical protein [Candidatus Kapabacteria bacterium]